MGAFSINTAVPANSTGIALNAIAAGKHAVVNINVSTDSEVPIRVKIAIYPFVGDSSSYIETAAFVTKETPLIRTGEVLTENETIAVTAMGGPASVRVSGFLETN